MEAERSALLIDWGGVLTTTLFASFHAYCMQTQIEPTRLLSASFPPSMKPTCL